MPVPRHFLPDSATISTIFRQFALSSPRRVAISSALLLVAMGVTTGILARDYHEARRDQAAAYFATAERDRAAGRADEAAVHYRAALSLERDNGEYRRRLAVTLLDLRLSGEAESRLDDLLTSDPVDGEANLLRGRVAAGRGNWRDAEAYYQRAIYGRWPDATETVRRLAARYELVELFEQMDARPQARAELLRLESDLPDVPFLKDDVARRFLRLGEPDQAARVLKGTIAARPASPWLFAELAGAELAAGRLTEARDAARRALALDPNDQETRVRLTAVVDALSLDPNARGLSSRERQRRSRLLLIRAIDAVEACVPALSPSAIGTDAEDARSRGNADRNAAAAAPGTANPAPTTASPRRSTLAERLAQGAAAGRAALSRASGATPPSTPEQPAGGDTASSTIVTVVTDEDARAQLAQGRALLEQPEARGDAVEDQISARLALAERIWRTRTARCGPTEAPVAWVFDRLAR